MAELEQGGQPPHRGGSGASGRGYSGSGGSTVVAYQDLESLDVDHYDFINAPQYVDFADLAKHDDPNADLFFETHREEDDFLISIDNISPTVQLLQEQQHNANVLNSITQEVNEAAAKDGMDDVQVVYYASPVPPAPMKGRKTVSLNSSNCSSFYTPMGQDDGKYAFDDKENCAPPSLNTPEFKDNIKEPVKKLSYSAAFADSDDNDTPRNKELNNKTTSTEKRNEKQNTKNNEPPTPATSLTAQLEKLQILSSDEEDAAAESVEESYNSPTKSMATDDALVNSLLKTPGAVSGSKSFLRAKQEQNSYNTTISSQKLDFFQGLSIISPSPSKPMVSKHWHEENLLDDITLTEDQTLKTKDMLFYKNEFPVFQGLIGTENDDRKMSLLVDPSVGLEVVWSNEPQQLNTEEEHVELVQSLVPKEFTVDAIQHEYISDVDDGEADEDETLTRSFERSQLGALAYSIPSSAGFGPGKGRRASSLSDLTSIQGSKTKPVLKSISKFGIGGKLTIPHSPDASKRAPSKCRSELKSNTVSTGLTSTKVTGTSKKSAIPIPYNQGISRGPLKTNTKFLSMAEQVAKFQKNTPDRFRSIPRVKVPLKSSSELKALPGTQGQALKSPVPSSSHISRPRSRASSVSRARASSTSIVRPSTVISTKTNGPNPVVAIPHRTTIPQPFHFGTTRTRTNSIEHTKDVPDFKFKARPMPKTKGPIGIHERQPIKVTQPIAPHFASDDRIRERNVKKAQSAVQSPTGPVSHPQPKISRIPVGTLRTFPVSESHKTTALKPFSFDQRDQAMLRKKEEKIKQEIEDERKVPEFHANPLPRFQPSLTKVKSVPATLVEPFRLESDERGRAYQQTLNAKLEEEQQRLREMATFHANPALVLRQPAFEPEHVIRPPLAALDLHLNTEKRAAEREQYENSKRQKELEDELRRQEQQTILEKQHRQEEIERRRQIVHKAQPFKVPKPFELKPSNKALTIPQSPAFNPLPSQRRTTPTKNTSM